MGKTTDEIWAEHEARMEAAFKRHDEACAKILSDAPEPSPVSVVVTVVVLAAVFGLGVALGSLLTMAGG